MKKIYGFLIAFILLIPLMTVTAFAYEIGYVSVDVTEPVPGENPVFDVVCHHENYLVDTDYKNSTNGVFWYDETDQKYITASDRFVEGHKYTVMLVLEPTTGNKFALDTSVGVSTAVSGSINGKSANVKLSNDSMLEVLVYRTFTLPSIISSVNITDIIAPVAGMHPEYDGLVTDIGCSLASDEQGNFRNGMYWFDLTDSALVKAEDTFIAGHDYRIFIGVEAQDGEYEFKTNANGSTALSVYINGNSAKTMKHLNYDVKEFVSAYYDFPTCTLPQVTSVAIKNLPMPQAGKAPGYTAEIAGEGVAFSDTNNTFTQNGICWSHKVKEYDLTASGFFFGGHMYVATINLDVKDGFEIGENVTATVNGQPAAVTKNGNKLIVKYEVACPDYEITNVDIIGVTVPAIGNNPSEDMQCAEPNLYVVKDVAWYVDDEMIFSSDKFVAGKNYDLTVYVDPKQEGWDYVAKFADKVAVTLNGNKVSEKKVERLGDTIMFTYTFTAAAAAKIGAVDIMGIDAPVAGESPDYTAKLPNSDTYKIDTTRMDRFTSRGVTWFDVTNGKTMTAGVDKFEKGNVYQVMVTVIPHDGYEFVTKSDGTPDVIGTVNGNTADEIMGRDEFEAIIVYKFPVCEAEETPEEPEKPAETEKPTEPQKPTEPVKPAEPEKPTEPVKPTEPEKPAEPEKPTEPEKPAFTDVEKDQYYYTPVMWAVENGITAGTSATTFSPDNVCTRAQVVTFLHRMVGSPEPAAIEMPFADVALDSFYYKPVKWAVGSSITGGTSATTFSPDNNCTRAQVVTFLWRAAGKPEPKGNNNPFVDVTADSYYYNAVLWAVENGITGGTSATTFSPDNNCTRAQVVTFLYRFINN